MTARSASSLCTGLVSHSRRMPLRHTFRYRTSWALVDIDELGGLERRLSPLFGIDRPRPIGLRVAHHLRDEAGTSLRDRADACQRRHGVEPAAGRLLLMCNLRVLGYVFDPVSLWYCHDEHDVLQAVIVEVNNTYGETHPYVVTRTEQDDPDGPVWVAERTKEFHVSPFLPVDMTYRLRIGVPDAATPTGEVDFTVAAHMPGDTSPTFVATQQGVRQPLTRRSLLIAQLRTPLMPQRITALIHWQALKLWRRKVRFLAKPDFVPHRGSASPRRDIHVERTNS